MTNDNISEQASLDSAAMLAMVHEFHEAFDVTGKVSQELQESLVLEEVREVREAAQHLLKELVDVLYVAHGMQDHGFEASQEVADELASIMYLSGAFYPWQTMDAFKEVHRSNMSKLDNDGKPVYREDGKIMKGPNYTVPDLINLI